jgi:hypothetical protein
MAHFSIGATPSTALDESSQEKGILSENFLKNK